MGSSKLKGKNDATQDIAIQTDLENDKKWRLKIYLVEGVGGEEVVVSLEFGPELFEVGVEAAKKINKLFSTP